MSDGTLLRTEAGPQIRFTRELAHSPEKVWRALTDPESLQAWFPDNVEGAMAPGAALRFFSDDRSFEFTGEVVEFDPPRVLELTWGTDRLRFELLPNDTGTTLVFTDTIDELGKAARDGAGWHECLDLLGIHLDRGEPPEHGAVWSKVHPGYVERFGPEASTIGPPG